MKGLTLWVAALVAGAPPFHGRLVEQHESLGGLSAFTVRADVHVDGPGHPQVEGLGEAVEAQMASALRRRGIAIVAAAGRPGPSTATIGHLMIDIHVSEAGGGTALAWTLHGSQVVLLGTGDLAVASTWEVGDLLFGSSDATATRMRDSLEPALDDFCKAVLSSRPPEPKPSPPAETSGRDL